MSAFIICYDVCKSKIRNSKTSALVIAFWQYLSQQLTNHWNNENGFLSELNDWYILECYMFSGTRFTNMV